MAENRCVCCGKIIPEGWQVCTICLLGNGKDAAKVEKSRADGWTSVEERLPEIGQSVLTLDKWGHIHDRKLYQYRDGSYVFRPDGLTVGKDITHWMPLPELPKEEK